MSTEQWLLLTDYSSKYRVSVSTLRRRIKNNQIPFRFEGGKYFLIDASPKHPEVTAHQKETPFFDGLKTLAVEAAPLKKQFSSMGSSAAFTADSTTRPGQSFSTHSSAVSSAAPPSGSSFNEFSDQLDSDLGLPRRSHVNQVEMPREDFAEGPNDRLTGEISADDDGELELDEYSMAPISSLASQSPTAEAVVQATVPAGSEPLLTTATNLLNELKRAYSNILQEKEEQMIQLKEEVSDLKTLVRVLEDETDRLRRQINEYHRNFESFRQRDI